MKLLKVRMTFLDVDSAYDLPRLADLIRDMAYEVERTDIRHLEDIGAAYTVADEMGAYTIVPVPVGHGVIAEVVIAGR